VGVLRVRNWDAADAVVAVAEDLDPHAVVALEQTQVGFKPTYMGGNFVPGSEVLFLGVKFHSWYEVLFLGSNFNLGKTFCFWA
jgi:hypothetical protein